MMNRKPQRYTNTHISNTFVFSSYMAASCCADEHGVNVSVRGSSAGPHAWTSLSNPSKSFIKPWTLETKHTAPIIPRVRVDSTEVQDLPPHWCLGPPALLFQDLNYGCSLQSCWCSGGFLSGPRRRRIAGRLENLKAFVIFITPTGRCAF